MSQYKNQHLYNVLESHRMKHISSKMATYLSKRDIIKEALRKKYGSKLAVTAINSGSYAKCTAINSNFDIDICQPFKRDSFGTLKEMADDVYDFFRKEFEDKDLIEIKKQRVSTGLIFLIDGERVPMDVTCGRELNLNSYQEDKYLNLYIRPKGDREETYTQTNITKHIDSIKGKTKEREIIRLMKIWKKKHSPHVKSFLVELLTLEAFENMKEISTDQWSKLKFVLEFIQNNIETIKLVDPSNSANVVSDTITPAEKKELSQDMSNILSQIGEKEERIKYYFPVNLQFFTESSNKSAIIPTVHFG